MLRFGKSSRLHQKHENLTLHRFIGSMPLSALFILFDFVVHNPTHLETKSNLSLLGVAAGYFCRLEYSSRGSLPSSLLSNFAGIARQYVDDFEANTKLLTQGGPEMDVDAFSVPPKTGNLVPPQSHNSSFVDCVSFTLLGITLNRDVPPAHSCLHDLMSTNTILTDRSHLHIVMRQPWTIQV